MKKNWAMPELTEMDIKGTAYHPTIHHVTDGNYTSNDGHFSIDTFGPSSGNSGTPDVGVHGLD